jgi:oxygen-independent coproporphyrinogen-3 oxidase
LKKAGLYVHFPFCRRACFYCHFFKTKHQPDRVEEYLDHLVHEMRLRRDPGLTLDSVYIGGGSPSLLEAVQVVGILEAAGKHFRLAANAEITLEANPEDISPARLRGFRGTGVNRLSVGAQSFQEKDLRFLKRTHGAVQAAQAVAMAREAGFANVSVDLIIGLPTQTMKSMKDNFRAIAALKPAHVSLYILEGVSRPVDDDRDARLYFQASQSLLELGFEHYEVSNFCLPRRAAKHNLKYWKNESYVGLGPSAAGYMQGIDYRNQASLKKYFADVESGKLPLTKSKQLDPAKRRIITGLRLLDGIPAQAFRSFFAETDFLLREGFLTHNGRNIAVPPKKILLLNEILGYFI